VRVSDSICLQQWLAPDSDYGIAVESSGFLQFLIVLIPRVLELDWASEAAGCQRGGRGCWETGLMLQQWFLFLFVLCTVPANGLLTRMGRGEECRVFLLYSPSPKSLCCRFIKCCEGRDQSWPKDLSLLKCCSFFQKQKELPV